MPNEYRPTRSARAISSSRCSIRSSGPTTRPVEGSVTAETKLSTPRCTAVLLRVAPTSSRRPFSARPAVQQVDAACAAAPAGDAEDFRRDRSGGALVGAQLGGQLHLPG